MIKFNFKKLLIVLSILVIGFLLFTYHLEKRLLIAYSQLSSVRIEDRQGKEIFILPNQRGYFARYLEKVPSQFKKLLIKKEDKYFYYHLGFNPGSIFKAAIGYLGVGSRKASSTITQQLVKILLAKESERNLKNKIVELFYALSLEIYQSKEEILKMYANSVYFGNQAQGIAEASRLYFGTAPELLSDTQILQLLASLSNPNDNNPAKSNNAKVTSVITERLGLTTDNLVIVNSSVVKENMKEYSRFSPSYFEITSFLKNDQKELKVTLDQELTEKIREIVKRNIDELKLKNAKNATVMVVKLPENEILTMIGSPDPESSEEGYKINMIFEPRPIGSTIKPFIYLKAFEKNLRPYTLVQDREYKYITALGFPLYPKNFDFKYRGEVNLHYALSNSLNVPAVKVLEYVGLENFYNFLEKDLNFKPVQSLNNYQLGIALGALEMNLWDLCKYFTIFPNQGVLKEFKIYQQDNNLISGKTITKPEYIQLINKILNDRRTGIEQFGLKSELNLFQENYALKTGTSRDFKDSWVIGYTPDFLVGVWVGNPDTSPTEEVSGQVGAGSIWSETMDLLLNSEYNKKTPFDFSSIKEYANAQNIEYGLAGDDYQKSLNILKDTDTSIILEPHDNDSFLLEKDTQIILKAKESVKWFVDSKLLGEGEKIIFIPPEVDSYQIEAINAAGLKETLTIFVSQAT